MCNLNNKGDSTIKLSNLDLFYKGMEGGCPVFVLLIYLNSKCHISAHIWHIGKNFQLSTSLEQLFQNLYKKLVDSKV